MSEDLFKEIDEDIRTEKLHTLFQRYAKWVVLILIVVLVVIGVWQFQQWRQHRTLSNASASYFHIMQQISLSDGQPANEKSMQKAAQDLQNLSHQAPQSIRVLSQLKQAALLINQNKVKEASDIWESIRFDKTAPSNFRSLANLLWVQNNMDSAKTKELRNRINQLLSEQTPWYSMAKECEALLDFKTGKLIEAQQIYGQLSVDMNASPGIKKRASVMLQIIANHKKG